jgi:hypothetical protein
MVFGAAMNELLEVGRQKLFLDGVDETRKELRFNYTLMLRKAFRAEANVLFQDHPTLKRFTFSQSSNPDNDFEFLVNRIEYQINGVSTKFIDPKHELYSALKDINEFMDLFDEDGFLILFGDHASVTVTAHNIEISLYDASK